MKTFSTEGIVLKRSNFGEADRVLTIFTKDLGKIVCVAKGVRRLNSSRRSALEPGSYAKLSFSSSHNLPILTQAVLINDFSGAKTTLPKTRSLSQVLEIIDSVTVEGEGQERIFDFVLRAARNISSVQTDRHIVLRLLKNILVELGYQDLATTEFASVSDYVEYLSDRKMKSFSYLTVG